MTALSVIVHNRELVVINDMATFAYYYCYTKKQKPGIIVPKRDKSTGENETDDNIDIGDSITPIIEYESLNTIPDDDIL